MTRLLHLSDTHFGTEQAPVREALVRMVQQQAPELLVLSGDITQRATPAQFRAARAFMERLNVPWVAIPGNHDIPLFALWTRALAPYARHTKAFGANLEPEHRSAHWLVLGVNTTRPWRHAQGEVSDAQIERVAQRLSTASAQQLRLVVVHQPVAVTLTQDRPQLLHHRARALQRWAEAGADLVLGGHIHLPYVRPLTGLARDLWAVQAGTALSSRTRPGVPNAVNLLHWSGTAEQPACRVEQWDYHAQAACFACGPVSEIQADRAHGSPPASGTSPRDS